MAIKGPTHRRGLSAEFCCPSACYVFNFMIANNPKNISKLIIIEYLQIVMILIVFVAALQPVSVANSFKSRSIENPAIGFMSIFDIFFLPFLCSNQGA